MKAIEVIGQTDDGPNDNKDAAATKSSPSPVPSDSPLKKRKVNTGTIRSTIPNFTNRPLTMSKTSETINIGALTMSQTSETIDIGAPSSSSSSRSKQELSSLDALAIAASASTNKRAGKQSATKPSDARISRNEGARLSSAELIGARGALHAVALGRSLPDRHSPSLVVPNIAARSIANQNQHQKLFLQLKKEDEERKRQILEEEQKTKHYNARKESSSIPKVPAQFSSLKIPEVPKGFVPMEKQRSPDRIGRAIKDLKSSIDRKILVNASVPSMAPPASSSARAAAAITNRLSSLDTFPHGSLSNQLQQQQHLQNLHHQASLYRKSANLLSLQLQASRNSLMQQFRGSTSLHAQQIALQQQIQQSQQMIDLASSDSDCDHSEITLKRRNGRSSETSSPMTLGASSKR